MGWFTRGRAGGADTRLEEPVFSLLDQLEEEWLLGPLEDERLLKLEEERLEL
ncbi:MAG: hypothetical protein IKQ10_11270 [Oscillospiraceae bacterium]|nr:hypothetical protein [Oscillospiraceae bacterium]